MDKLNTATSKLEAFFFISRVLFHVFKTVVVWFDLGSKTTLGLGLGEDHSLVKIKYASYAQQVMYISWWHQSDYFQNNRPLENQMGFFFFK